MLLVKLKGWRERNKLRRKFDLIYNAMTQLFPLKVFHREKQIFTKFHQCAQKEYHDNLYRVTLVELLQKCGSQIRQLELQNTKNSTRESIL